LRERKGAPTILKIAKELETAKSDLKIVVVGQNHEPYLSEAATLKNIEVLGMESDEALANLLTNAFGFLFLSYYEGFGIPVLEAMAAGVPVISSNQSPSINIYTVDKRCCVMQQLLNPRLIYSIVFTGSLIQLFTGTKWSWISPPKKWYVHYPTVIFQFWKFQEINGKTLDLKTTKH